MDTPLTTASESLVRYVEEAAVSDKEWVRTIRHQALEKFLALSWPTQSQEEWRRTDVSAYALDSYTVTPAQEPSTTVVGGETSIKKIEESGGCLVPLAACLDTTHSDARGGNRKSGATENASASNPDMERHLHALIKERVDSAENRFQLWNLALLGNGWLLYLPAACALPEPLALTTALSGRHTIGAPHTVVIASQESGLDCIHTVTGSESGEFLALPDCTLSIGAAAKVNYALYTNVNLDSIVIANGLALVERDARFRHGQALFGGLCAKLRVDVRLKGAGASAYLDGIYLSHQDQHFDLRTVQQHLAPNTQSFALYRGGATDESHTIYQGVIQVAHEAVGTDAYLTNNNLLLSDEARSDSIPSLNISTDEVKCSHGSTTGAIDELQCYYLQCRGLSRSEAISCIVLGFFEEVIARFPESVQAEMRALIESRIPTDDRERERDQ